jgi:hypothetical protein
MKASERIDVTLLPNLAERMLTWHEYQRYYAMGLRMLPDVRFQYASAVDRVLASVHERGWRGANAGWRLAAKLSSVPRSAGASLVGRYTFHFPDREAPLRVAIDAHDVRSIWDPDAYDWSDVYFKANYWPSLDYGRKARPLVAGHGALDRRRIARLIGLRNQDRNLDLVFVARLWAGQPGPRFWNPVEHVVTLFETLAKLKIRSYLLPIVPTEQPVPQHFLDRLSKAGAPATTTNISIDELWRVTSASRIAFVRPGKHLCISWRMIDHLAMGACTVFDHPPYPQWPVPLQAGREFMDGGCGIGEDGSLSDPADYERIADTVMALLADPERVAASRLASTEYFDQHVAPERIAGYLMDVSQSWVSAPETPQPVHKLRSLRAASAR